MATKLQGNLFGDATPIDEHVNRNTVESHYQRYWEKCQSQLSEGYANIISYGGGRNSTAAAILLAKEQASGGELIDVIIFADTGAEKPETYDFIQVFDAWLRKEIGIGITLTRNFDKQNRFTTLVEECQYRGHMPSRAFGLSYCSDHWKIRPLLKKSAEIAKERGVSNVCDNIGIHYGEMSRLIGKNSQLKPFQRNAYGVTHWNRYPLIEHKLNQAACVAIIQSVGLPIPPKSACYICPYSTVSEVNDLRIKHPVLYEIACSIEKVGMLGMRKKSYKGMGGRGKFSFQEVGNVTPLEQWASEMKASNQSCNCIDDF